MGPKKKKSATISSSQEEIRPKRNSRAARARAVPSSDEVSDKKIKSAEVKRSTRSSSDKKATPKPSSKPQKKTKKIDGKEKDKEENIRPKRSATATGSTRSTSAAVVSKDVVEKRGVTKKSTRKRAEEMLEKSSEIPDKKSTERNARMKKRGIAASTKSVEKTKDDKPSKNTKRDEVEKVPEKNHGDILDFDDEEEESTKLTELKKRKLDEYVDGDDLEVSFKKKKIPIYANSTMKGHDKDGDVYDPTIYGPEVTGQTLKEKPKKKRKYVRKKKANIILAFGQETRDKVMPILKTMKNLATPQQPQPPHQQQQQQPQVELSFPNISNITQGSPPQNSTSIQLSSTNKQVENNIPSINLTPIQRPIVNSPLQESLPNFLPPINNSFNRDHLSPNYRSSPKIVNNKLYKTPFVPKVVSSKNHQISTPRENELNKPPKIQDLVQQCFGFTDSEDENSLIGGFSPVQKVSSNMIPSPAGFRQSLVPSSGTSKPFRFPDLTKRKREKIIKPPSPKKRNTVLKDRSNSTCNTTTLFDDPVEDESTNKEKKQYLIYEYIKDKHGISKKVKGVAKSVIMDEDHEDEVEDEHEECEDVQSVVGSSKSMISTVSKATTTNLATKMSSKVYKKKTIKTNVEEKPSPKKNKKQEKLLNQWASLQTSHFDEVDDFDLSFI